MLQLYEYVHLVSPRSMDGPHRCSVISYFLGTVLRLPVTLLHVLSLVLSVLMLGQSHSRSDMVQDIALYAAGLHHL